MLNVPTSQFPYFPFFEFRLFAAPASEHSYSYFTITSACLKVPSLPFRSFITSLFPCFLLAVRMITIQVSIDNGTRPMLACVVKRRLYLAQGVSCAGPRSRSPKSLLPRSSVLSAIRLFSCFNDQPTIKNCWLSGFLLSPMIPLTLAQSAVREGCAKTKSNHSRTYQNQSRKSNDSRTYANPRGSGDTSFPLFGHFVPLFQKNVHSPVPFLSSTYALFHFSDHAHPLSLLCLAHSCSKTGGRGTRAQPLGARYLCVVHPLAATFLSSHSPHSSLPLLSLIGATLERKGVGEP